MTFISLLLFTIKGLKLTLHKYIYMELGKKHKNIQESNSKD